MESSVVCRYCLTNFTLFTWLCIAYYFTIGPFCNSRFCICYTTLLLVRKAYVMLSCLCDMILIKYDVGWGSYIHCHRSVCVCPFISVECCVMQLCVLVCYILSDKFQFIFSLGLHAIRLAIFKALIYSDIFSCNDL